MVSLYFSDGVMSSLPFLLWCCGDYVQEKKHDFIASLAWHSFLTSTIFSFKFWSTVMSPSFLEYKSLNSSSKSLAFFLPPLSLLQASNASLIFCMVSTHSAFFSVKYSPWPDAKSNHDFLSFLVPHPLWRFWEPLPWQQQFIIAGCCFRGMLHKPFLSFRGPLYKLNHDSAFHMLFVWKVVCCWYYP